MIRVLNHGEAASLAGALCKALAEALSRPGPVMIAGGTTPLAAYRLLAELRPPIHPNSIVFFSDDRHVPLGDPRSNFGNSWPHFAAAGLSDHQMIRVAGERPLPEAEQSYSKALESLFAAWPGASLGILGLGTDGHTASLFTPDDVERSRGRWAVAVRRPDGLDGISATPTVFQRIQRIVIVVSGAEKRAVVDRLLRDPDATTAGLALRGHRGVEVWCDAAAWPFDGAKT
ncbi:MAG: 6-phosphogluconolactonase [Kiritimatiellae bacterium]|nr:6-phosphogluconolactonase [Kiritimatiellia bacterium]MDW8458508.1 6-phosphogluconolactonase [Verrucomicrobiota bacterium]